MKKIVSGLALITLLAALSAPLGAQEPIAVPGEVVAIPLTTNAPITLDGDLGDWATLPAVVTNDGPIPSADPANSGQMRWQVAADENALYFAATITDNNIIAGRNGDDYWNEDSIELYLNFSGDAAATAYGPDIGQITFSAVDRGNTDPTALTLSGNGAPSFDVAGFVFATTAGWGVEVAINLDGTPIDVADGNSLGIQVQANGSSGGDRDLKLGWSVADVDDMSFQDPSVFGRGVFVDESADVLEAASVDEAAVDEPADVEASVEPVPALDDAAVDTATDAAGAEADNSNEPEPGRTLLIAAVFSAASILIGGLWFERRRKKSEAAAAAAKSENADANVDELIASILDD